MTRALAIVVTLLALAFAIWLAVGGMREVPQPSDETEASSPPEEPEPVVEPPPATHGPAETHAADLPELTGMERSILRVEVVGPDGTPVPKVVLRVEHGTGEESEEELLWVMDGRAEVERKHPDEILHLVVEEPRDAQQESLDLLPRRMEGVAADVDEVTIALTRARTLQGMLVDLAGRPVPGVAVLARPSGRASDFRGTRSAEDGTFVIKGLPPGPVELHVPLEEAWLLLPVVIREGAGDVRLQLVPKADLVVEILADDGRPVPAMRLEVRWEFERIPFSRTGETDEEGRFHVSGVPATASFSIRTMGTARGPKQPDVHARDRVYEDGTIRLRLPPSVSIEGLVVDVNREPIPEARVEVSGDEPGLRRVTRGGEVQDGRFRIDNLAPGRYLLKVIANRRKYAPVKALPVVAPADAVRIILRPAVTARGIILGEDPRDVVVQWFSHETWAQLATVDASGAWTVDGIADSPGSVYAFRKGTHDVFLLEDVRPTDGPIEIRTREGLPVAGRLQGYEHDPNHPLLIGLVRGPVKIPLRLDTKGAFRREGVPPGLWRIEILDQELEVLVAGEVHAGTVDLELEMP